MDFTLAYSAFPCAVLPLVAQNPAMPSCFRANFVASIHFFKALVAKFFLARADAALLTILPLLLLVKVSFVKPPTVFAFLPLKTNAFAILPRAITLVRLTFMAFMAFIAFMAFMAFIAFMAFVNMADWETQQQYLSELARA